jgi:hypothetical protein
MSGSRAQSDCGIIEGSRNKATNRRSPGTVPGTDRRKHLRLGQIKSAAVKLRLAALLSAGLLHVAHAAPAWTQEGPAGEAGGLRGARAHDDGPALTTARVEGTISLDGKLDEPAWRRVAPVTEFTQTEPNDGTAATERTEVYILFDDDALYVGARLHDSGPVRKRLGRRDTFLSDSDWFYVMLDAHHDHLTAYQFSINPAGVLRDELMTSSGRPDASWDAIWDAAVSIDDDGWSAELRIPFSQLRFGREPAQTWGLQLSRRINRKQEVVVLAHTPRDERGGVARYGHLAGLHDLKSGKKLEVQPYTMARAEHVSVSAGDPYRDGRDYFGGAGLDVKYRVTSNMLLDGTVNPDFGQVELDPAVVNLSAFETSFEEKRPFFVEGSSVFAFGPDEGGGGGNRRAVFYSRRIGRAPQGALPSGVRYSNRPDAATILGAAKLTGRTAHGLTIGVLAAATEKETAAWTDYDGGTGRSVVEPFTGYLVGRVRQDLRNGQTTFGGIGTYMQRDLADASLAHLLRDRALTAGLDFTHQFLDRAWSTEGYIAFSHAAGSTEAIRRAQLSSARYYARPDADYLQLDSTRTSLGGYTARLELGKRAGLHWRGEANVSATSPGYEVNDLGFETTVDRLGTDVNLTYVENTPSPHFRNYRISLNTTGDWNYGGDMIVGRASLNLNAQLSNYWNVNGSISQSLDAWDDRLTRGGPVARDPGGYSFSANVNSDTRERITGRANWSYSRDRAGGWHHNLSFNASLRPAEFWTLSFGPRIDRRFGRAQYMTSVGDTLMTATYGRRYIFSPLRQSTASMDTRLNINFSPTISLELFAQPFASSADYLEPTQLHAARTYTFDRFGQDVGTVTYNDSTRSYTIDADGAGPASSFSVSDNDFVRRSLRGNAVLRWEWRPGSSLFVVWQQRRSGSIDTGRFEFGRDMNGIFDERPENVFVIKMNYWLNL